MTSKDDCVDSEIKIEEFENPDSLECKPAQKSLKEILETDSNDEKTLLSGNKSDNVIVVDENNLLKAIIKKFSVTVDGKEVCSVDLPGKINIIYSLYYLANGEYTFNIKEGSHFKLNFQFFIQRDIVSGLKYLHKVSRHGIEVTKEIYMIGSYSPRKDIYLYSTPVEEAPSGFTGRGNYRVRSLITDDDQNRYLEWVWNIKISKE